MTPAPHPHTHTHSTHIISEIWLIFFGCVVALLTLFLPVAPYVKVYLLNNGAYVAKKKTKIARKTLDPLYQQALLFEESPHGKVLQVSLYHSSQTPQKNL